MVIYAPEKARFRLRAFFIALLIDLSISMLFLFKSALSVLLRYESRPTIPAITLNVYVLRETDIDAPTTDRALVGSV